jgi:hypothetical protein
MSFRQVIKPQIKNNEVKTLNEPRWVGRIGLAVLGFIKKCSFAGLRLFEVVGFAKPTTLDRRGNSKLAVGPNKHSVSGRELQNRESLRRKRYAYSGLPITVLSETTG